MVKVKVIKCTTANSYQHDIEEWFKNNIPQLEKVWKIIEQERVTGYEHRAPAKKVKKEEGCKPFTSTSTQGCLLKWIKKLD